MNEAYRDSYYLTDDREIKSVENDSDFVRAWSKNKTIAKTRIGKERTFAKNEIRQTLKEIEEGEDFRYRHQAKVTKNEKLRIKNKMAWYERIIEDEERRRQERIIKGLPPYVYWNDGYWVSSLNELKNKYEEKYGTEND